MTIMNNKKKWIRLLSVTLSLFVAFGLVISFTPVANAASGFLKAVQYDTLYVGSTTEGYLAFEPVKDTAANWDKLEKCKLVSIKSSNPKVLGAKKYSSDMYDNGLIPKKVGKSVITVKYKYGSKTYTITKTCVVKKYSKAIKTLTVNGKTISLKSKSRYFDYNVSNYSKTIAKIRIAPSSGWKISSAYITKAKGEVVKSGDLKTSVIKKGNSISIPKGYDGYIFVTLECTSGTNKGDNFNYAETVRKSL